jgi:hypothetical protein
MLQICMEYGLRKVTCGTVCRIAAQVNSFSTTAGLRELSGKQNRIVEAGALSRPNLQEWHFAFVAWIIPNTQSSAYNR